MPRPAIFFSNGLFCALFLVSPMTAQEYDAKELAKARFEAEEATLHDLIQAQRDAVNLCFRIREGLYLAGANEPAIQYGLGGRPVTLPLVLETWAKLVETELARSDKTADRRAVRGAHWLYTWETEQFTEAKYRIGRESREAYMEAQAARLDDEIKLLAFIRSNESFTPFYLLVPMFYSENLVGGRSKELAKAQFEIGRADRRSLAKERRDALAYSFNEYKARFQRGEIGHDGFGVRMQNPVTLDRLLDVSKELSRAELALSDRPSDRRRGQAKQWRTVSQMARMIEAAYRVRRVGFTGVLQVRSALLAEEMKLSEMLEGENRSEPILIPSEVGDNEGTDPESAKEWAKAQCAVVQAQKPDLAIARKETFELAHRFLLELYRNNVNEAVDGNLLMSKSVMLDRLVEVEAQSLMAGLDLSNKPTDRLAAYEKDWEARYIREAIAKAQYLVGRESQFYYERVRFARLGAEIRLLEFREKIEEK